MAKDHAEILNEQIGKFPWDDEINAICAQYRLPGLDLTFFRQGLSVQDVRALQQQTVAAKDELPRLIARDIKAKLHEKSLLDVRSANDKTLASVLEQHMPRLVGGSSFDKPGFFRLVENSLREQIKTREVVIESSNMQELLQETVIAQTKAKAEILAGMSGDIQGNQQLAWRVAVNGSFLLTDTASVEATERCASLAALPLLSFVQHPGNLKNLSLFSDFLSRNLQLREMELPGLDTKRWGISETLNQLDRDSYAVALGLINPPMTEEDFQNFLAELNKIDPKEFIKQTSAYFPGKDALTQATLAERAISSLGLLLTGVKDFIHNDVQRAAFEKDIETFLDNIRKAS